MQVDEFVFQFEFHRPLTVTTNQLPPLIGLENNYLKTVDSVLRNSKVIESEFDT